MSELSSSPTDNGFVAQKTIQSNKPVDVAAAATGALCLSDFESG
jgi:hypothetical protein